MGTESEYTLYAVWKANTNTLHFNGNGATSGTMEDMTIATDATEILIPNGFEKTGYHFIGWATSADGEVEFLDKGSYPMGTKSEYTLYAVWEANVYTIAYNTDGGTWEQGSNPSTFTIEDLPVKLTFEPVIKNDHTFFGWYEKENFSGEVITEFTITDIGDITFYAKFVAGTEGLQYIEENGGYTVRQYSGSETEIVIPDFHDDKPVLSIQGNSTYPYSSAFENGINSITFGMNTQLTSIGDYAFYGCSNLVSIEIPSGVTSIGSSAFYDCSALQGVYITDIEAWCAIDFYGYDSNPLYYAHNLYLNDILVTKLTIPDSITEIKNYAFYGYNSLTSIEIPSGVTSIGISAFFGCSGLTSIEIPSGVTSISDSAFRGCSSLTSIEIPSSVTSIGDYAFSGCRGLTSIEIPSGVTSVGDSAFNGCSRLASVIFGKNSQLTSIGSSVFYECSNLTSIEIPNGVTIISIAAFRDCSRLTSIEIPSSVTSIGEFAFYGCSGLTSIEIPSGVTSIGISAFFGCSSLNSIEIPNSVTSIGVYAFRDCSSLTTVIFGENSQLTSIGNSAFYGCSGLDVVYYGGINQSAWDVIEIGNDNTALTSATRYYYSENEPNLNADGTAYDGNYWHYVGGVPTIWVKEQ